ncbi:hypothetical protein LIQ16_14550, partial [Blautia schinkii]
HWDIFLCGILGHYHKWFIRNLPHRVGFVDNHIGLEYTWFIKRGSKKSLLSEKSQSKRGTGDY